LEKYLSHFPKKTIIITTTTTTTATTTRATATTVRTTAQQSCNYDSLRIERVKLTTRLKFLKTFFFVIGEGK
jgi:hypothetical protein